MLKRSFFFASLLVLATASPAFAVVDGAVEPDYKYPWVVDLDGTLCGGVLIEPQWVLTAAHCVQNQFFEGRVSYSRKDANSGYVYSDSQWVGHQQIVTHPAYNQLAGDNLKNDIALIRLSRAFSLDRYIQTVGLPATQRQEGVTGLIANGDQRNGVEEGQNSVFRGPMAAFHPDYANNFEIKSYAPGAEGILCRGDSGSGLVTYENGRAVVRGVARETSMANCATATTMQSTSFSDVFFYKSWILQVMRQTEAEVAGNSRVRWSGSPASGAMGIACNNSYDTQWGPVNAPGAEVGSNCERGKEQVVICSLDGHQAADLVLKDFRMTTIFDNGATTSELLPLGDDSFALYSGLLPAGVTRIFNCKIGLRKALEPDVPGEDTFWK